jgi:hypothetical protein
LQRHGQALRKMDSAVGTYRERANAGLGADCQPFACKAAARLGVDLPYGPTACDTDVEDLDRKRVSGLGILDEERAGYNVDLVQYQGWSGLGSQPLVDLV